MATGTAAVNTLVEQFQNVLRVSTPLVQIQTTDAASVAGRITEANKERPIVQWDASAGFHARTLTGKAAIAEMMGKETGPVLGAADAVFMARRLPADTIMFVLNAHKLWAGHDQAVGTVQGIWNLRDVFKSNNRCMVMLTTLEAVAPRELESDLIVINDPLPDEDQLRGIILTQCAHSTPPLPSPDADTLRKAIDALKGLPSFVAEQLTALALTRKGVDVNILREKKRQAVSATPGATLYTGPDRFSDIGGNGGLIENMKMEINGKRKIKVVVIFDEFEKMMAGASSDHVGDGGVAKDKSQVMLTNMQDRKYRGVILFGHPGAGKTAVAKAMGNEADCLVITADMGAMSGGIVGESEARVRQFWNMVYAIAGEGGAFVVATCNSTGAITTEMRRRFKSGFYFVDLPSRAEKDTIWKLKMRAYGLKSQDVPDDTDWTGSDIENCCEKADNYGITLLAAGKQIVPVAKSNPALVEARRREAHNAMLSAQTGTTYQYAAAAQTADEDGTDGIVGAVAPRRNVRFES